MDIEQIKRITPRVTEYLIRTTSNGKHTITIWYDNIADTIFITNDNTEVIWELMNEVDRKHG